MEQSEYQYEWCCPRIIDSLKIDMTNCKDNILKLKPIMHINHLEITQLSLIDLPALNQLIKMYVMPIKSIEIRFRKIKKKITMNEVEQLIQIVQYIEEFVSSDF